MVTVLRERRVNRPSDLSTIRNVIARLRPGLAATQHICLMDVAKMCRARTRAMVGGDCHAARDALLTIACERDLQRDQLDEQSDACLAAIAGLLP